MMLQVTGSGLAPIAAGAVVLTVTAMAGTTPGSLIASRAGITSPNTPNLSWGLGESVTNLVTVRVGNEGQVALANTAGSVDLVVDLDGYYAQPIDSTGAGHYFSISPFRLLDTRESNPIGPGASIPIKVAGSAVPPAAEAAVLNVTAVDTTARSSLAVVPGTLQCAASGPDCAVDTWSFTWAAGSVVSSRVIAPLGKGPDGSPGWISVFNPAGSVNVLVDVEGWYADSTVPATMGSTFNPIDPCRALVQGPFQSGPHPVALAGVCDIRAGSTAVVLNVTLDQPTASGDLTIAPSQVGHPGVPVAQPFAGCSRWQSDTGISFPNTVDLIWRSGQTVANLDQAALSASGTLDIGNVYPPGRLTLDVSGYFTPEQAHTHQVCMFVQGHDANPSTSALVAATVFDLATNKLVPGDNLSFTVSPVPGGAPCTDASLDATNHPTDSFGSATVVYKPASPGMCLITARDPSGASASMSAAFGILGLIPTTRESTVHVDATYRRADGTPHPNSTIDFRAIVSSLSGTPVANGRCTTDGKGQCSFSYRLGNSPAGGYTGATIVFAQDAAGLQVSVSARGSS